MEFGDTLTMVNLAGLIVVGFVGWMNTKSLKQYLMELMNRDLAEIRRQIRTSMKSMDRLRDHVADNREDILKIEVNIASMQDELEAMSRKLDDMDGRLRTRLELDAEGQPVDPDDRRHLLD